MGLAGKHRFGCDGDAAACPNEPERRAGVTRSETEPDVSLPMSCQHVVDASALMLAYASLTV